MSEYMELLEKLLRDAGAEFKAVANEPAYTAQEAAALAHVRGHAFAKTVVVIADGGPVLLAIPAPHVVDTGSLERLLNKKEVRLAAEEDFRDLFPDCELGAIPPFSPGAHVPLYLDERLLANTDISFKIGSNTEVARLDTKEYLRLASPLVLDFAVEPIVTAPEAEPNRIGILRGAAQSGWLPGAMAAAASLALPVLTWRAIRSGWLRGPIVAFTGGIAVGGALAALADPRMGGRRRALARDKGRHYLLLGLRAGMATAKDGLNRAEGLRHRLHHRRDRVD